MCFNTSFINNIGLQLNVVYIKYLVKEVKAFFHHAFLFYISNLPKMSSINRSNSFLLARIF
jgi:hypothetical protein